MVALRAALSRVVAVAVAAALTAASASSAAAQRTSSTAPPPEGWSRRPRWQATLQDGSYLWELTPTGLRGDTLLARQADTLVRVPLERIDELRLVRASQKQLGAGAEAGARATFGALAGADDEVYLLSRYPLHDRRRIVEQALAAHPPR